MCRYTPQPNYTIDPTAGRCRYLHNRLQSVRGTSGFVLVRRPNNMFYKPDRGSASVSHGVYYLGYAYTDIRVGGVTDRTGKRRCSGGVHHSVFEIQFTRYASVYVNYYTILWPDENGYFLFPGRRRRRYRPPVHIFLKHCRVYRGRSVYTAI